MSNPLSFDNGYLETLVSKPQRENEGAKDTYVSYLVTTKTDFKSFMRPETSVRRRFTDFVFLYTTLCKEYPAVAVPPLPDKHNMAYVRGAGMSSDFTTRRAHSLHRFLKRISLHPELRRSSILLQFLESPEWHATMKSRPGRGTSLSNASDGGGILDSLADTFINTWAKVHKPDKRFIEVRERANKLDEDLSHVEKKIASVAHKQAQLETDYSDLTQQFQKLQALEPGVEQELTRFARSLEDETLLVKALREYTDLDYLSSLRDMSSYIDSQKSLLKAREQKQLDFEGLTDYLAKAAAERDGLASERGSGGLSASGFLTRKIEDVRGIDHEQARRDKIRKLELQIEKLTREVEQARINSEMFDDRTVAEVAEFERIKAVEFKDTLGGLADAHLDFFKGTISTWEKFLKDMEKDQAPRAEE
ncbi:uncharacterized protein PV09_04765 [Verruconis gallopava]|uniref:Sorting nexin-4 n=1 Tax=Verruconis gallopava TaxID=253628 RepID=A0A0D2AXM0_9PEZI|nr:uncharacterized protein PV09_04765 [Verruconis gallopava]KIW03924.1 hypothetical protein PV09_04765 [Verruconis gallopava]